MTMSASARTTPHADRGPAQQAPDPRRDRSPPGRGRRCAAQASGPHDPTAVERHPGQQAQGPEHEVEPADHEQAPPGARPGRSAEPGHDHREPATMTSATTSDTSGPGDRDRQLVAGARRLDRQRGQAADEAELDRGGRHAAAPTDERVRELVGDDRREEAERDDHADEPVDSGAPSVGAVTGGLLAADERHERERGWPRRTRPGSRSRTRRATGTAARSSRRPSGRRRSCGRGAPRRRPSAPASDPAQASARTITTTPTPIVLSTQNCCGKSWTRRSVPRVEQVVPAREEDLVEQDERRSKNRSCPPRPPTTVTATMHEPVRASRRQNRARASRPTRREEQERPGRPRRSPRRGRSRRTRRARRACGRARCR